MVFGCLGRRIPAPSRTHCDKPISPTFSIFPVFFGCAWNSRSFFAVSIFKVDPPPCSLLFGAGKFARHTDITWQYSAFSCVWYFTGSVDLCLWALSPFHISRLKRIATEHHLPLARSNFPFHGSWGDYLLIQSQPPPPHPTPLPWEVSAWAGGEVHVAL